MAKKKHKPGKPKLKFSKTAPQAFAVIGYTYPEIEWPELESFMMQGMDALLHTKDLKDAARVMFYFNYLYFRWNAVENMSESLWKMTSSQSSGIEPVPDEETVGVYYITNGLISSEGWEGALHYIGNPMERQLYDYNYNSFVSWDNPYQADENSRYHMTGHPWDNDLQLFKDDIPLAALLYNKEDCSISAQGDSFPYHLITTGKDIAVYGKEYISKLEPEEAPDPSMMLARIQWCVTDEEHQAGLARLDICNAEKADTDLLLLLSAAYLIECAGNADFEF
ncbi:MAG: hypothetical protein LUE27_06380 [Clostridia bacterium]|nr:hypothetical protein [Clostridia bacterium]